MNCIMPGLLVHQQLPGFTQTHVHWVGDAVQPSHPLSSPSPPALSLSKHQGLFKWVSSSHQVTKVLVSASTSVPPVNTQDWSPSGWTGFICLVNSLKVLRSKSCLSCVRILRDDRKSYSFHWDWLVKIYPIPRLLVETKRGSYFSYQIFV